MTKMRVVDGPRQSGKTTALLQSAMHDPDVVIIVPDMSRADWMRRDLAQMLLDRDGAWMSRERAQERADRQVLSMVGAPTALRGRSRDKTKVKIDGLEEVLWLVFNHYVTEAVL